MKTLYIHTEKDVPPDVANNPMDHNYNKLVEEYCPKDILKPGNVFVMSVSHDNACAIYSLGNCNCHPNITIRDDKDEMLFSIRWVGDSKIRVKYPKKNT